MRIACRWEWLAARANAQGMQEVPEKIGDYEVVRELGRGAMGVVYLARHPALGREMALKVMAPELARDPEFMERFRREGEAAARLRHPNIVGVFDFATRDGLSFIAMEFLGAQTLKDLIEEKGQQPVAMVGQFMQELLSALATAHAKGIVHRDIKPANIMLTDEGSVALTDFSIAHMKEASKLTQTGAIVGTPEYMAPEQFDGKWDARTDLYAAGIVFYELLTGFSPFRSQTMTEVMRKQLLTVPDPPHAVDFTIPPALSAVVSRALEKEPELRFQSALEMADAVKMALAATPATPEPVAPAGAAGATPPTSAEALVAEQSEPSALSSPIEPLVSRASEPAPDQSMIEPTVITERRPEPPLPQDPVHAVHPQALASPGRGARAIGAGLVGLLGVGLILVGLTERQPPLPPAEPSPVAVTAPAPDPDLAPSQTWDPPDIEQPAPPEETSPPPFEGDPLPIETFPSGGSITPGFSVGNVFLGMSSEAVRQTWGEPATKKRGRGVTSWIYGDGDGDGKCLVTIREKDNSVVMLAVSHPGYSVEADDALRVGKTHQTIERNWPEPTTRTKDVLDYRDDGILFTFEGGACKTIVVYFPDTKPHLEYL